MDMKAETDFRNLHLPLNQAETLVPTTLITRLSIGSGSASAILSQSESLVPKFVLPIAGTNLGT